MTPCPNFLPVSTPNNGHWKLDCTQTNNHTGDHTTSNGHTWTIAKPKPLGPSPRTREQ